MENIISCIKHYFILIIVITIIIISVIIYFVFSNNKEEVKEDISSTIALVSDEKEIDSPNYYFVDIKGEVKKPGVYEVEEGTIINDVIKLAGGLTSKAVTTDINLSKKVTNEMVIYISSKNEFNKSTIGVKENVQEENKSANESTSTVTKASSSTKTSSSSTTKSSSSTYKEPTKSSNETNIVVSKKEDNKEIIYSEETKVDDYNNQSANEEYLNHEAESNSLININTASMEELQTLPSIGASKADKIIAYREENGSFKSIEDIKNVSGIGDSLYDKIKDYITV